MPPVAEVSGSGIGGIGELPLVGRVMDDETDGTYINLMAVVIVDGFEQEVMWARQSSSVLKKHLILLPFLLLLATFMAPP